MAVTPFAGLTAWRVSSLDGWAVCICWRLIYLDMLERMYLVSAKHSRIYHISGYIRFNDEPTIPAKNAPAHSAQAKPTSRTSLGVCVATSWLRKPYQACGIAAWALLDGDRKAEIGGTFSVGMKIDVYRRWACSTPALMRDSTDGARERERNILVTGL